jgi:plastocyanin
MKNILCTLLVAFAALTTARAGNIIGTARAEGKAGADDQAAGGEYASRKYKFAERVNYAELHDFVIYIQGTVGTNAVVAPTNPVVVNTTRVTQQGAMFNPHVLPVVAGTTVEWPNNDQIFHNVFSVSDAKPFDLGLYKGNPPEKRVTFDKPGRVDVFCSIHANMHCVVLVLENPYFAVADSGNHYSISNIPPGTYKLTAWHERMPLQAREITVPATGDVKADFVLGITNLPQY